DGPWVDKVFLQQVGGTGTVPLGTFTASGFLGAGKSYTRTEQFTLPENQQGAYQVVVTTNATSTLFEIGAGANTLAHNPPLQISLPPRPDLQVLSVTAPDQVGAGETRPLSFVVVNQGTVPTGTPQWKDNVYLSLNNKIDGG